jgi:RimJ/RimL family protein N-acetyltransferase
VQILETTRLSLREIDIGDSEFVVSLLNTPKFIKYIGDRGVRTAEDARVFIENRYRQSYRDHGYGLYTVALKEVEIPIGVCGFVRRDTLPGPDIGFAFLPEFEGLGYGFESADAIMGYGRNTLGFSQLFAITSQDNDISGNLLLKLGFSFQEIVTMSNGEELKLYERHL